MLKQDTPSTFHDVLTWSEQDDQCKLEYSLENQKTQYSITFKFSRKNIWGIWSSECTDIHSNQTWAEIETGFPIRVQNSLSPQFLIKSRRPNWLDYSLYSVSDDRIEKSFSFSCRQDDVIKWGTKADKLRTITTYDRFETPPARLTYKLPKGVRVQYVIEWHFNAEMNRWRPKKHQWQKYKFGSKTGHKVISSRKDCPFLYVSTPNK